MRRYCLRLRVCSQLVVPFRTCNFQPFARAPAWRRALATDATCPLPGSSWGQSQDNRLETKQHFYKHIFALLKRHTMLPHTSHGIDATWNPAEERAASNLRTVAVVRVRTVTRIKAKPPSFRRRLSVWTRGSTCTSKYNTSAAMMQSYTSSSASEHGQNVGSLHASALDQ